MEEFAQSAKRRGLSAKSWAIVAAMVIVVILIASAISTGNHSTDSARTLFVSAEGVPVLIIKPNAEGYSAARAELNHVPAETPGVYRVNRQTYERLEAALGLEDDPEDEARLARWKERTEHWANVNAFLSSVKAISADRVIDKEESARICQLMPQWQAQLSAARDYVVNYRNVEPDTVEKNGLGILENEANRGLNLLFETKCI